ncbi:MAG: RNA 2',3'-cyclic phosphodiesterase [Ruminococcus sp.]|nr:RNA 2',3'-cyclic phosphodiesterase [Ruminococcus sp.]
MRLFIALEPSDNVKTALLAMQGALKKKNVKGRFTPCENFHLTLAFIGEYPDAGQAADALSQVSFAPFEITVRGLGCFGDTLWAGVEGSQGLEALAKKIRHALALGGIPFDKKSFSPHITLARKAEGDFSGTAVPEESMMVTGFTLFSSTFGKNGMLYTPLYTFGG